MLHVIRQYWTQPLPNTAYVLSGKGSADNQTKRLVTVAFFGALSALLQSAGGFVPGPGYLISPFATAPIVLAAIISLRSGVSSYLLAAVLLLILQPSELIVFPFTTGLLGLALGYGISRFRNRLQVLLFAALLLLAGIVLPLYGFRFPFLGPSVVAEFRIGTVVSLFLFSCVYSGIWMEVSLRLLSKLAKSL